MAGWRTDPVGVGVGAREQLLSDVLDVHAARGARVRVWLRAGLVVFVWATLVLAPPTENAGWCYLVAAVYPVGWAALELWLRRPPRGGRRRRAWVVLVLDIVVLAAITLLAGASAQQSWTAYIVVTGFFLLPVLAATQLRPGVGVAVAVATVAVYLFSTVTTREANDEPWPSLVMRVCVLAAVCAGSVALSRIQRSRVLDIAALARARAGLLTELTDLEARERRELSEALHDGALQYVLAARMDLEDLPDDADAVGRVDHALTESARLLRTTVGALHPAVLQQSGLLRAVDELATGLRRRGIRVDVVSRGLPDAAATNADRVVYDAVRELLQNVVKHADASTVTVELVLEEPMLTASVVDDGTGFDPARLTQRLADGHIGLASQRLRVEAFGGRLDVSPAEPRGTRAEVVVPTRLV